MVLLPLLPIALYAMSCVQGVPHCDAQPLQHFATMEECLFVRQHDKLANPDTISACIDQRAVVNADPDLD